MSKNISEGIPVEDFEKELYEDDVDYLDEDTDE